MSVTEELNLISEKFRAMDDPEKAAETIFALKKSLLEHHEALKEANSVINDFLCYRRDVVIKDAEEFQNKYKHLLEE